MVFDRKKYMDEYNKQYYLKNKEKIKENVKSWSEENPDKMRGYVKKINSSPKARIRKDKWINDNPEKNAKSKRMWRKNNYQRDKIKVQARIKAQQIPLKKECGICKSKERLERHHWRYDKPLLVSTLCKDCHSVQHTKNFVGGGEYFRG